MTPASVSPKAAAASFIVCLLAVILLTTAAPVAIAEEPIPETNIGRLGGKTTGESEGADFGGSASRPAAEQPAGAPTVRGERPLRESHWMPKCGERDPGDLTDRSCDSVTCKGDGTLMYETTYTRENSGDTTGTLGFSGEHQCLHDGTGSLYTAAQVQFFRAGPALPAPGLSPPGGVTLVGVFPTLFWTSGDPQTTDHVLLGTPVRLKITPVSYSWNFGDGSAGLNTAYPGIAHDKVNHPLQKLRGETDPAKYRPYVIHRYERAGQTCHTSVTITYRGQYSVQGGVWNDIDGTIDRTSPPRALATVEYRSQLEAEPRADEPSSPPLPSPATNPDAPTDRCTPTVRQPNA